jgi:hypothetical protein
MEVVVFDSDEDEGDLIPIFLRGPASEQAGDVIAAGVKEEDYGGLHAVLIGFPFYMLPDSAQAQIVSNSMEWFRVDRLP